MENEIVLNGKLSGLLANHGVRVHLDNEFVHTNLASNLKFKARALYHEIKGNISSRLDIMAVVETGEQIVECFGDAGATVDEAINRNFQNFALSSLHPILAAFGCQDPETLQQVEVDEWVINERAWKVYLGSLVPKSMGGGNLVPPDQFFQAIEREIRAQQLANKWHWFRSYYCQLDGNIVQREFLMDNEAKDGNVIFESVPILANVKFYSCRNFILLKGL